MAFVQKWENSTAADPLSIDVSTGGGPTSGNILVAFGNSNTTVGGSLDTAPSGFSDLQVGLYSVNGNQTLSGWYKVSDGTETSVSLDSSSNTSQIGAVLEFSGRDTTTPLDVAAIGYDQTNGDYQSTTADLSITPVTDGCDLAFIAASSKGFSDRTFDCTTESGTTSAWTVRTDQRAGYINVGSSTATQTTAGAITARVTVNFNGGNTGILVALRPAAGGGSYTLTSDTGSFTLSGTAAGLIADRSLTSESGSFTLSGTDATFAVGYGLIAESASFTYSGTDAGLIKDSVLVSESGSFTYSGTDAGLLAGRLLTSEAGSFTLSGTDANLIADRLLTSESATFTLSGTDATLTYTPLTGDYTLTSESGGFNLFGTAANLIADRLLTSELGSYTLSGTDAGLNRGYTLDLTTVSFDLSGTDLAFSTERVLASNSGTFTFTGTTAILTYSGATAWTVQHDTSTIWSSQSDSSDTWSEQANSTDTWTLQ